MSPSSAPDMSGRACVAPEAISDGRTPSGFTPEERHRHIRRVTWTSLLVNLALSAAKAAAGALGHSQALLADAVHSLSDLATDVAILVGVGYWSAPADRDHPHGHRKVETLVTLFIGAALAAVGAGLAWKGASSLAGAVGRAAGATPLEAPTRAAFGVALASIAAKEWLYRWTRAWGARLKSAAVVANAWHHRSDALSSIPAAVAVGGAAVGRHFGYDTAFLDPVGAVVVSVLILHAAWRLGRPALGQLLDEAGTREACERIERLARSVSGVAGVHALRTRQLGPHALAVDLHVQVDPAITVAEGHAIGACVKYLLLEQGPDVVDAIIHLEPMESVPDGPGRGA